MEDHQNETLIHRVPSEEAILARGINRNSNAKALKVTGLTVLACLLLAGQGLTAYLVWGQREHISALSSGQEKLKTELSRKMTGGAPKEMRLPMNSLPLIKDLTDETSDQTSSKKQSSPLLKLRPVFTNQREGSGQQEVPRLMPMRLPMAALPLEDFNEEAKSAPESVVQLQSKCQLESAREVRPGYFKPECDEQGNYKPKQCWHSTGYCWCVDKEGNEIPNTRERGRPVQCSADILE